MLLVLDASVIAKWFKEEENSKQALKIREKFYKGEHEIIVPDLILYELSNALRYDKKFNPKLITKAINTLFEMDINITIPSGELISETVKIATENNITAYDATYIALSTKTNATFITADNKLIQKIKHLKNCKPLSDF